MLLRFTVSNFLSFAEEVEFNMFPSNLKIHKDHVYDLGNGVDVLKAAAVYGANGSGKSNFVNGLLLLKHFVFNKNLSFEKLQVNFKLDKEFLNKPTKLEIEFKFNSRYLIYGISFWNTWIEKEWLYESFPEKNKQILVFEREKINKDSKNKIKVNKKYTTSEKEKLRFEIYEEELLSTELFLGRIGERIEEGTITLDWFNSFLYRADFTEGKKTGLVRLIHNSTWWSEYFVELLNKLGTGISKIDISNLSFDTIDNLELRKQIEQDLLLDGNQIDFVSKNEEFLAINNKNIIELKKLAIFNQGKNKELIEFSFSEQSDGTKKILQLIPLLLAAELYEATVFIDEIERSLHPTMIKELLTYFMSRPTKGQLIFTTHESHLLDLDIFRQDEIWFTEKNEEGATRMYPLSDFKPRYDLDIQKGYLAGRFGAIPFIGNLKDLISTDEKI